MFRTLFLFLFAAFLLAACAPAQRNSAPTPVLTPPQPQALGPAENPGSIFDPAQADFLFADNRARRVGDVVMVNIVETSKGSHKADTTADRESTINFGVQNWLGKNDGRFLPVGPSLGMKGHVGTDPMIRAGATNEFKGTGETTRESNVTATIAARVVNVLPNGLLQIEGAREVKVNKETQILVVRGLVRAKDIRPDNSILSCYVADAKIEYYGRGVLADKQGPGWLTRILDHIWPF